MKTNIHLFLTLLFLFIFNPGQPCTTFVLKSDGGTIVFGRNFDFPVGMGHIQINQRGKIKTAFISPQEFPIVWVANYGSISFNQIGREFPYGGMNEAGLVIEQMWLQEAVYPEADDRFGLTELQWIQYQLDNSATVDEVIATNEFLRISYTSMATLHFLVADKSGAVAAIEYLDGKMTVRQDPNLPYPVLANCPYEVSEDYLQSKLSQQAKAYSGWTENSSGRFALAAEMIDKYNNDDINHYAFEILRAVAQPGATQWSIVYNLTDGEICFNTLSNIEIRSLRLDDFDYSCSDYLLYADMHPVDKSALKFTQYCAEENLKLLNAVCEGVEILSGLPQDIRYQQSIYPLNLNCSQK